MTYNTENNSETQELPESREIEQLDTETQSEDRGQEEEVTENTEQEETKVELTPEQQAAFNKAYFEKKQAERDAEELRKQLEELKAHKNLTKEPEKAKTLEDFDFNQDAYDDYRIEQKLQKALQNKELQSQEQIKQTQQQQAKTALMDNFNTKATSYAEKNPDYSKVIQEYGSQVQYAPHISEAVLEIGPELDHHLLSNPVLADKLNSMSTTAALIEIGKISTNLNKKKALQVSNAPDPINNTKGTGRITKGAQDSDDMKTWYAKEMARLEAKGK